MALKLLSGCPAFFIPFSSQRSREIEIWIWRPKNVRNFS
uniref:Uncharacterized protein n=1 Tax=Rhizophora mucronata TaxID=61149 RepID=A0A2P2KGZ4_RHIMU